MQPEQIEEDPRSSWTLVLVAIQVACLVYLAVTGPLAAHAPILLAVQVAALLLGLWALVVVRPWNVNVAPLIRPGASLVTRGPYRWVRHPMYTALLVLTGVWLSTEFSPRRLVVWLVFVANMVVKLLVEEHYLARHFDRFGEYKRGTWRLIPFVF
jgi:protein-S-isoprenylcysteine O-methyltransferase Ste14